MVYGHSEFDVPEVTRTLVHALFACCAAVSAVDGAQLGIVQTLLPRALALLVHRFGILDVANAHVLDLLGREEAELDLLHRLERRLGVREGKVRHDCGGSWRGRRVVGMSSCFFNVRSSLKRPSTTWTLSWRDLFTTACRSHSLATVDATPPVTTRETSARTASHSKHPQYCSYVPYLASEYSDLMAGDDLVARCAGGGSKNRWMGSRPSGQSEGQPATVKGPERAETCLCALGKASWAVSRAYLAMTEVMVEGEVGERG